MLPFYFRKECPLNPGYLKQKVGFGRGLRFLDLRNGKWAGNNCHLNSYWPEAGFKRKDSCRLRNSMIFPAKNSR
ncbi:hypothetical protein XT96_000533 [Salmonella enterica subsp. enterica serovar Havana]|nr:hypothetical protein [Salmonella enterica]EBS6354449.1 hypothetical protein [Salmonella enterica subsp. enterica serovar Albany]ECI4866231.1 hypothetical protein [Salmonella enterica subsp. enterica]EDP9478229.1 hypothetical protein [Salmonella enterica subsp. enterica serovar Havana]